MNIIFDYDGTLHETIHIYEPAFREAYAYLVENGYAEAREFSTEEIQKWVGYSSRDMWRTFMPELPEEVRVHCSEIVGLRMKAEVEAGNAKLYKNVIRILEHLKENGHTLIFLSNCKERYMQAHTKAFELDKYFDAMYCAEYFDFIPKAEILPEIMKKYPGEYIVVGDRANDIEMGIKNGFYTIGCRYGYGTVDEIKAADAIVNFPLDILSFIPENVF